MVVFCVSFCLGIYDSFLPSSKYANSKPIHSLAMTVLSFFFLWYGPMFKGICLYNFFTVVFEEFYPIYFGGLSCACVNLLFLCSLGVASGSQEISEDNSVITVSQCDQLLLLTSIPTLPRFKSLLGLKSEEDMDWA